MKTKSHRVSEYMTTDLVTLHPDMDVLEAFQKLTTQHVPGAPVIDNLGNLVGGKSRSWYFYHRANHVLDFNACLLQDIFSIYATSFYFFLSIKINAISFCKIKGGQFHKICFARSY